jgi:hypothetical protein
LQNDQLKVLRCYNTACSEHGLTAQVPQPIDAAAFKIVAVQLETGHANSDGTAWYAYCNGTLSVDELGVDAFEDLVGGLAKADGAPLGLEFDNSPEEVPNLLSNATGLRRYWVASAV